MVNGLSQCMERAADVGSTGCLQPGAQRKRGEVRVVVWSSRGDHTRTKQHGCGCGIGGLPKEGAVDLFYLPSSDQPQTLTLKDVPNGDNAFWSLTVYDKDGFPSGTSFNLNSAFAKTNAVGDVVINLGGDSKQDNYLEIYPGWNATFRIYNPKPAYFDGSWIRPELELK